MKQTLKLMIACLMAVSLVACSNAKPAEEKPAEETAAEQTPDAEEIEHVTTPEEEEYLNPNPDDAIKYLGTWVCGRATIEIAQYGEPYEVQVTWGNTAAETTFYKYDCYFDGKSLVNDGSGEKKDIVFDEQGNEKEVKNVLEDCAAVFTIQEDGTLIWQEFKEDAARDMVFERIEKG